MHAIFDITSRGGEGGEGNGAGRQAGSGWLSTQYSVLDTRNPLLEYLQSKRERVGGREISSATSAALMASTFGF